MLKLIFKNLWSRRRRNGWLLAERILVSIISWIILDPVIVVTHDRKLPLGYDADRLCLLTLTSLSSKAPGYDEQAEDSARLMDDYLGLVRHAASYEGVELATPLMGFCYPSSHGSGNASMIAEGDSVDKPMMWIEFLPHTRFFETYGFRPGKGRTPQELSDYTYGPEDIVLNEAASRLLFGTPDGQGRRCVRYSPSKDTTYIPVAGMVGDFKILNDWHPIPVMFRPIRSIDMDDVQEDMRILVRLREGVSMKHFLHGFRPWALQEMRRGNLFVRKIEAYEEVIADREADTFKLYQRNLAMAVFFLVNLCLGVIGTFWLQTRTRREEVGVMLSFGGTPGRIVRLLMGEGVILTVLASCIGFLIYLQYALSEGLNQGVSWIADGISFWVSNFALHFLIVSALILLLLLAVVLIGIYVPARNISRVPPTEALRDE